MKNQPADITDFLKLILEALEAAKVDYLIGGAVAEWAWGEPRATQDLDFVIDLPIKAVNKFSKELEKRHMLVPAEIILDTIVRYVSIVTTLRKVAIVLYDEDTFRVFSETAEGMEAAGLLPVAGIQHP